jgi:hypothetical protein
MPRALPVVLGGLLATGLSVPAAWGFPTSRLTYSRDVAAQRCPDEAFLRHAVAERLGYDPFFPWATRTIAARIAVEGHGLRGTVDLIDAEGILRGSRELTALPHQCQDLVDGMALAISIAIDPDSVDRVDPPSPKAPGTDGAPIDSSAQPAPSPGPVVDPPSADDGAGTREPAAPRPAASPPAGANDSGSSTRSAVGFRLTPELHAGMVGSTGLSPSWSAGPSVGAFLRASAWSAGVEGRYQFVNGASYPAGRISSTLVGAAALTCGHPGPAIVCAQFAADRLTVSGDGVDRPRSDAAFVWRTGARAGLDFPLRANLALGVHADVLVLLEPTSIELDGQVLWRAPLVSALGGATLQGRFP